MLVMLFIEATEITSIITLRKKFKKYSYWNSFKLNVISYSSLIWYKFNKNWTALIKIQNNTRIPER